jgi:DNA polymerase-3 subunit beta
MKFTILKSTLLEALNNAGKCINSNNVMPILGCYRLKIAGNTLSITGGNAEVFLTTKINLLDTTGDCDIAISAQKLNGLIKELSEQPLIFTLEEKSVIVNDKPVIKRTITIKASTGKYTIPVEDGSDYLVVNIQNPTTVKVPANNVFEGVSKCLYACKDDMMNALGGVNVVFNGKAITYNGCDNFVLSTRDVAIGDATEISLPTSYIIPPKVLTVLLTLTPDDDIEILLSNRHVQFTVNENTILQSVLIDAKYPNVEAIIPVANDKHVLVDRLQLIGALKRVSQFSLASTTGVTLNLSENQLLITGTNVDFEEAADETITVDYVGEPLQIGFSAKLMIASLAKMDVANAHLSFGQKNIPIVIRETAENLTSKSDLIMVMPFMI